MFDKRLFAVLLVFICSGIMAQNNDSLPVMTFDQDTVDFGVVNEGDTVIKDFWFTNTGKGDLVIKQAHPACGCTYPTYTSDIIKPGGRGKIHVEFHSQGFGGHSVVKDVIVIYRTPDAGYHAENYARFKAKIINKAFEQDLEAFKKSTEGDSSKGKKEKKRKKKSKKKFPSTITPDF